MTATAFSSVFLYDMNGVIVSQSPQRASALSALGDGNLHLVWYGGNASDTSSVDFAHQINYARFQQGASLVIAEMDQPLTVTGFDSAYSAPYNSNDLWQEHCSSVIAPDGTLHVAWEARDAYRMKNGKPSPGIAYMFRRADGTWSQTGQVTTPNYLAVSGLSTSQSRPKPILQANSLLHIICYGSVKGVQQILFGSIASGSFGGWNAISPNANDQRHVSATADSLGQIHAVWREGQVGGPIVISYAARSSDGTWSPSVTISTPGFYASTPNISVDGAKVRVVWIEWVPGTVNSTGQTDNNFPNDDDTVEGVLMFAFKPLVDGSFTTPITIADSPSSYASFAQNFGNLMIYTYGSTSDSVELRMLQFC
jgi:hypothetical protein